MSRGTPKTLNKAVQNAFEEYKSEKVTSEPRLKKHLLNHLRDYIRNKISPAYLIADDEQPEVLKALKKFMTSL